jgi:FkbM family methyltransferase
MGRAKIIELVGRIPLLSRVLRWYVGRYPEGSVVTIASGQAQGMKYKRFHRYLNGFWLGQFELEVQDAIARELHPGDGFFDVGANAGFFSLLAVKKVGPSGWCVSFDPDPDNYESLCMQIELNQPARWQAVREALAEQPGKLTFARSEAGSPMGHLLAESDGATNREQETFEVDVTTLDEACERFGKPAVIKMDVEGAEVRALRGAARVIREIRPVWIIELHSTELAAQAKQILGEAGYRFFTVAGNLVADDSPLPKYIIARPASSGQLERM